MSIFNLNKYFNFRRVPLWSSAMVFILSAGLLVGCSSDEETEADRETEETKSEVSETSVSDQKDRVSDSPSADGSDSTDNAPDVVERPQVTSGIRPVEPHMVGLCRLSGPNASTKEKRECNDYLPSDIDQLAPGSYVLHAGLHVPKERSGQSVQFVTYCRKNGTDRERRQGKPSSGTVSPGNPETGYRFWGTSIDVPDDAAWASDCTWELSAGDNRFVGSWAF